MNDAAYLLCAEDVTFGFSGRAIFLRPISVLMRRGECWGIVGPNGAGKSTFLRLLAGLHRPTSGTVRFEGLPLDGMRSIERACRIAFLPQNPPVDFPLPVEDVVLMGRFPHRRLGLFENAADRRIAESAMRATQTEPFRTRLLNTLSGGEAQRVHLAAALAQQPRALLLDEPTAALDLHHQIGILELLKDQSQRDGVLVVIVTHDLNLANRYCSQVMLLNEGRCVACGIPEIVLTPDVLEPVYRVAIEVAKTGDGKLRVLTPAVHAFRGAGGV